MTPKQKAIQLVEMYDKTLTYLESKSKAKQCALIAVDMMIYYLPSVDVYPYFAQKLSPRVKEYWGEVKQEIEKL